jgi:hypothetical protein
MHIDVVHIQSESRNCGLLKRRRPGNPGYFWAIVNAHVDKKLVPTTEGLPFDHFSVDIVAASWEKLFLC